MKQLTISCFIVLSFACAVFSCNRNKQEISPEEELSPVDLESGIVEIVFLDLKECCACMAEAIEVSRDALANGLGKNSKIKIDEIHIDAERSAAQPYLDQVRIFTVPAILFLSSKGKVIDLIQGSVDENDIRQILSRHRY